MRIAESTAKILANIPLPDEVAVVHRQAAVVDIGSCTTRVGFAGDDAPRIDEPTCVVKDISNSNTIDAIPSSLPRTTSSMAAVSATESSLCLKKAYDCRATAEVSRVVGRGEVDWEAMEQLLQHLDNLLQLSRKEIHTPLLLTEKLLVPRAQRLKLTEILIEKHAVSALHFAPSPVLALYAAGACTGVSVEMGFDASHVVPIFQGCPLFHAVHALGYGGDYFTRYMMKTGVELPQLVHPRHRIDVWQHLKEKYCEACPSRATFKSIWGGDVAAENSQSNFSNNISNSETSSFNMNLSNNKNNISCEPFVEHQLPDGTIIKLDSNRFVPAEMLLDPSLVTDDIIRKDQWTVENVEQLRTFAEPRGIHQLIVESVSKCDLDLSPIFYDSIHFSGGCSLLRGVPERIGKEIYNLTDQKPRIMARTERRNAAFVGGSILASLPTFQDFWVTKAEYEEFGASAVLRRCF